MKLKRIKNKLSAWPGNGGAFILTALLSSSVSAAQAGARAQGPSIPSPQQLLIIAVFGVAGLAVAAFLIALLVKAFKKNKKPADAE
ncbi:MAG: hypothetical protein KKH28_06270 [Elusimicrobia bacterium]|nr:hypothetical protein [Elusimicrobiota bacterium]